MKGLTIDRLVFALRFVTRTAASVLLGVDVALAIVFYAAVAICFREAFDFRILGVVVAFALLPDLDVVLYLALRKRLRRPSHRRIAHHPLVLVPLAAVAGYAFGLYWHDDAQLYFLVLCAGAVTQHFVLDSIAPQGLHWLSPVSWSHYSLYRGRLRRVPEEELDAFFERKSALDRSLTDEIDQRLEPIGRTEAALWLFAMLVLSQVAIPER